MQPAHNFGPDREASRSQDAQGVARMQTAARKLLSCMRRQPQCDLHQGPPRAAHALRRMPARSSSAEPPKAEAAKGLRLADSGLHTSKTLMLQELEGLLAAVPEGAPAKAYRVAIVEENVLGKRTFSARKETVPRLTALHGLDPNKPLFRMVRRLWDVDPTTLLQLASYSQLGWGCSRIWDLPPASVVTTTSEGEG